MVGLEFAEGVAVQERQEGLEEVLDHGLPSVFGEREFGRVQLASVLAIVLVTVLALGHKFALEFASVFVSAFAASLVPGPIAYEPAYGPASEHATGLAFGPGCEAES